MPAVDFALLGLDVESPGDGTFSGRGIGLWHVTAEDPGVGKLSFVARVRWADAEQGGPHSVAVGLTNVGTGDSEVLHEDVLVVGTPLTTIVHDMQVDGHAKAHFVVSLIIDGSVVATVQLWTG